MSNEIQKANILPQAREAVKSAMSAFVKQYGENRAREIFARESGFAIMAMQGNDMLQKCSPESIQVAVACVALTGISLNPTTKLAYLIPRKGRAILDISYMGMIEILRNSGSVKSITGAVVYEGEDFHYKMGTDAYLHHVPSVEIAEGTRKLGAYAVAVLPDGTRQFLFMRWQDIMKRKAISASGDKGPWAQWEDEMAVKTVIRGFYKYLPKTEQATQAMQVLDELQNAEQPQEAEAEYL